MINFIKFHRSWQLLNELFNFKYTLNFPDNWKKGIKKLITRSQNIFFKARNGKLTLSAQILQSYFIAPKFYWIALLEHPMCPFKFMPILGTDFAFLTPDNRLFYVQASGLLLLLHSGMLYSTLSLFWLYTDTIFISWKEIDLSYRLL